MEISPYKFNLPGGDPKPDYVHVVSILIASKNIHFRNQNLNFKSFVFQASCPDDYRGKFNRFNCTGNEVKDRYVDEIASIVNNITEKGRTIAAYIAESFQSCGGQIIPPEGYFQDVYR